MVAANSQLTPIREACSEAEANRGREQSEKFWRVPESWISNTALTMPESLSYFSTFVKYFGVLVSLSQFYVPCNWKISTLTDLYSAVKELRNIIEAEKREM